jgi:hypothetical protein
MGWSCLSKNPSDPFKAWDSSITFDYKPRQWLTFRWSMTTATRVCRTGPVGAGLRRRVQAECPIPTMDILSTTHAPMGLTRAYTNCGGANSVWFPDLRRDESIVDIDIMVKF